MDLWVVAAATGAGYLAKHWKRVSNNSDNASHLSLSSEDSKFEDSESPSHPLSRQAWRDELGKDVSSDVNLLNGLLAGKVASTSSRGLDSETIRCFRTYNKSNVLSISNLPLPISPNEDTDDVNEQSSNTGGNYGFQFSDSSTGEVGSKHHSAGNKISLRRHLYGHFSRPVNSLESCLMAQLCMERAKMEDYFFGSLLSHSTAKRSFLVCDGSRIISRKSTDSSSALIQSEQYKLHGKDFYENDGNAFRILALPKIGSLEDPKKVKFKAGKKRSGRMSSSNNAFSGKHMHSRHDAFFLVSLGISFGTIASMMANKREIDNLRGLLKQTENLVQDLQEEHETKDLVTVMELNNEKYGSQDMYDHSFYEKEINMYSPEKHISNSPRNGDKELYDLREEESSGSMSKIEAELEAELERLRLNMNTSSLHRRLSDLVELDPEFEADFVQGELRTDTASGKAFVHLKSNEDASDMYTPLPTMYAVSTHELSLRLHEVIQSRLEERVRELEIALVNSQRKVQMMASEHDSCHRRDFLGCGQASPFTRESLLAYDDCDHPLVVNFSGEALDAYNEAYEELVKSENLEENSPSGIYKIDPKEGSHSHGWCALGIQDGGLNGPVTYSTVNGEKMSGELTSSKVTMFEGQSSDVSKLNVVTGDDNSDFDYEIERQLIRKIVERTRKGSPVFQNAQRILYSNAEDEF